RFQEVEEAHLRHMKGLIGSYSHSVEDTHVQIGQVHEEFKQNVENIGTEMLLRRFAESKGTGRERPGALDFDEYRLAPAQEGKSRSKAFRIPGLSRKERERGIPAGDFRDPGGIPAGDFGDPGGIPSGNCLDGGSGEVENPGCSSSDSDYDEDEPRKFYVHIKPVQPQDSAEATVEQLKATVGNLILAPGVGVSLGGRGDPRNPRGHLTPVPFSCRAPSGGRRPVRHAASLAPACSDTDPEGALAAAPRPYVLTSSSSPFSSSSPENVEDSGLDSPSHPAPGPSPDSRPWSPQPGTPQSPGPRAEPPPPAASAWAPRPRSPPGRAAGMQRCGIGGCRCPPPARLASAVALAEPLALLELRPLALGARQPGRARLLRRGPAGARCVPRGFGGVGGGCQPCADPSAPSPGLSRGPSPVVLGSQDALPVATAFTEYVHAYFKGRDADSCLVKVTGELTMSFPAGIVRVFGGPAAPPVLSFRLLNAGAIEQFLPNAELLYSDPSQSDPSTKDFWLNMAALTGHLQKQAEQSPAASYYNVALLKYQFSRLGPGSAPLRLCVRWDCAPGATRVSVEYGYNAAALALPVPLANVHVLLPVEEPLTNLRLQPAASWNLEEKRLLWKLLDVPGAPGQGGCGRLSASWEPLGGPSKPSPVAAQFSSEGSTLSGVEVELAGAGYRMSLVKKRFATG
ncbi:FCHO1 protein, partial [Irena cyanogastra]|nr:FCHO1 protein [Irena cyanogastra]